MNRSSIRRVSLTSLQLLGGVAAVYGALRLYKTVFPVVINALGFSGHTQHIVGPLGMLPVMALVYALCVRWFERRRPSELALRPLPLLSGAAAGAALIGLTIGVLFLTGFYLAESHRPFGQAVPVLCTILAAACLEEFIFRGLLFQALEKLLGTGAAVLSVALLFGALHLSNPGTTPLTMVSVSLLGAFWCAVFIATRNLWVAGLNHACWNMAIFLSGVPLSGQESWRAAAPLVSEVRGPFWLTGGDFGPEDSVVNLFFLGLALWLLWRWLGRRGLLQPAAAMPPNVEHRTERQRHSATSNVQ